MSGLLALAQGGPRGVLVEEVPSVVDASFTGPAGTLRQVRIRLLASTGASYGRIQKGEQTVYTDVGKFSYPPGLPLSIYGKYTVVTPASTFASIGVTAISTGYTLLNSGTTDVYLNVGSGLAPGTYIGAVDVDLSNDGTTSVATIRANFSITLT